MTTTRSLQTLLSTPVEPGAGLHDESVDVFVHYPNKISDRGYTVVASILTFTWVFGTILNIFCLVVFLANKWLRSPTNMFVMSLNFCDLCMSCVGTFMSMTSSWNKHWLYGPSGCTFEGFMVYFLGLTSLHLLCAIAFDRYIVIAKPLLGSKITHMVAGFAIGLCWLFGFLWAAFPLFGWNTYVLEGAGVSCSIVWESANPNYTSYIFTIFVFCMLVPLFVIVFSYYGVFMTIHNMSRNQAWDETSRIAKRNMKVEKKMAKTIAYMLMGYLGCWLPYTIFSFIVVFQGSDAVTPELATYPAIIAKSQGLINPIIYVGTNKQFRQAFYSMLPCTGLRAALEKREEEKDSDAEDDDDVDNKQIKASSKPAKGNTVAPASLVVDAAEKKTIEEYLEVPSAPKEGESSSASAGGSGGSRNGAGKKKGGKLKNSVAPAPASGGEGGEKGEATQKENIEMADASSSSPAAGPSNAGDN